MVDGFTDLSTIFKMLLNGWWLLNDTPILSVGDWV